MRTIEAIYQFASDLGYDVQWIAPERCFKETVSGKELGINITVQQDGDHLVAVAPITDLKQYLPQQRVSIMEEALQSNAILGNALSFGIHDDELQVRFDIQASTDLDLDVQRYLQGRQQLAKVAERYTLAHTQG